MSCFTYIIAFNDIRLSRLIRATIFPLLHRICDQSFLLVVTTSSFETFSTHEIFIILWWHCISETCNLVDIVQVSHLYGTALYTFVFLKFFLPLRFILLNVRRLFTVEDSFRLGNPFDFCRLQLIV